MGIESVKAESILKNHPRGYFKNNSLFLYQGNFNPLSARNLEEVRTIFNDLKKLLDIKEDTKIFSGIKIGEKGEDWPPLYEISL